LLSPVTSQEHQGRGNAFQLFLLHSTEFISYKSELCGFVCTKTTSSLRSAAPRLSMAVLPPGSGAGPQRCPPRVRGTARLPPHCPTHCLLTHAACKPTQGTLTPEPRHTTRLSSAARNWMHCTLTPHSPMHHTPDSLRPHPGGPPA
jgi:hypothetical protein